MSNYGPQMGMPGQPPMGMPGQAPMGMPGPQMGAQPPKKKGLSTGCMIVLFVVLGFLLLMGGIFGYCYWKVANDPDVKNVMGAIGDAAEMAAEAQKAPGTNELRALGCEEAMAFDSAKMAKIGDRFDAGISSKTPPEIAFIVTCTVRTKAAPKCEDAAKAYVKGASPTSKFMLTVQANGNTTCGGTYSPTGAMISPIGGSP